MPDYLPFQRTIWDIRDWTTLEERSLNIFIIETVPLSPGQTKTYDIITIPAGSRLFVSGLVESFERRSETHVYITGGPTLFKGYKEEFMHFFSSFAPTLLFPSGINIKLDVKNVDIVAGRFSVIWQGFILPASEPEKPKNSSPSERFRVMDCNYCTKYYLPNNEVVIIFNKFREDKKNILRLKDYGTKKEKLLGEYRVEAEISNELINSLVWKPEKTKEILEKLEKRFKRKPFNFFV